MKKLIFTFLFIVFGIGINNISAQNTGDKNPMVGGASMYKNKDIVDNAVNSKDHTTLVAAVKAAGLVETLKGKGPYTVFAPTNAAFDDLSAGTVDTLLKSENKTELYNILTYHIVAGKYDSKKIAEEIKKGKGKATLTTVAGGILTASMNGNTLVLTDERGGVSRVTIADVRQSNGVIHVVDNVLNSGSSSKWIYHGNIKGQVLSKNGSVLTPLGGIKVALLYKNVVKSAVTTDNKGWYYFDSVAAAENYSIKVNQESKFVKSVIDETVTIPPFILVLNK